MPGDDEGPYLWVTVDADASPRRIVVRGELDAASAGDLVDGFGSVDATGVGVDLDLAAVTFMDSSGLRSIIEAYRRARAAGFRLQVTAASEPVRRVFDLTGTSDLLVC